MLSFLRGYFKKSAKALRDRQAPAGYYFLRNYKACHQERLKNAIRLGRLTEGIVIVDQAYDAGGQPLPTKVSIYGNSPQTESLFYQFYALEKAAEKRRQAPVHSKPNLE